MNQRKAGVVLSYISIGLRFLIALIYTPIMLRLLGKTEFGLFNFAGSIISYLALLSFGFSAAYMRFYARYRKSKDHDGIAKLNGLFLSVYLIFSLLVLFSGTILVYYSELIVGTKFSVDELLTVKILMSILVIGMTVSFVSPVFDAYIIANEKFIFQRSLQIVSQICNPLICLPILFMGYKSIGLVLGMTFVSLSVKIISILYCFKKLSITFRFNKIELPLLKEIAFFSFFIFINMIIDQINWNVDKFLIGRFRGAIEVAEYGLASQLNNIYLSMSLAISSVFIPAVNFSVNSKNSSKKLTMLFSKIGRIQFIILSFLCILFVFFGKEFLIFWAGKEYENTYSIALFLLVPVTFVLIQNIGIEIQNAYNKHHFRAIVYFIIAIFNVLVSVPLIKSYGALGAAIGTAIALIIGNIFIMNIYYHKKIKLDIIFFWKEIIKFIPALLLPLISAFYYKEFFKVDSLLSLMLGILIFSVVFIFSFWFLGVNDYEKNLLTKPLKNFIKLK